MESREGLSEQTAGRVGTRAAPLGLLSFLSFIASHSHAEQGHPFGYLYLVMISYCRFLLQKGTFSSSFLKKPQGNVCIVLAWVRHPLLWPGERGTHGPTLVKRGGYCQEKIVARQMEHENFNSHSSPCLPLSRFSGVFVSHVSQFSWPLGRVHSWVKAY